jgi:hypothetical protein
MNPSFDPTQLPLRDIHLPDAVAWWPPAAGWWVLAALALVFAAFAMLRYRRLHRHRAARRALEAIIADLNGGASPAECAQRASIVLRRFAMTIDADAPEVAGLVGERWLDYLAGFGKVPRPAPSRALIDAPYRVPDQISAEEALSLCRECVAWVRAQPARA